MTVSTWTKDDSTRAKQVWSEYENCHDLSTMIGQTAGIEPSSGRIWFGDSIEDVVRQRDAEGSDSLLYFVRVGYETYYRKGGHR
jgi:hypothetical protein